MSDKLRIVRIVEGTSVDGPGLRTSIYFAGCRHECPGCHNSQTWDFSAGDEMTVEEIMDVVRRNGFNVTFTGGDPLYSAAAILPLAKSVKEEGYTLWCYTGFVHEEIDDPAMLRLLEYVDVLVDGPFIAELRDTTLHFRGSSNQRIIELDKKKLPD